MSHPFSLLTGLWRRKTIDRWSKAFPAALHKEVAGLLRRLPLPRTPEEKRRLFPEEKSVWTLLSGEKVFIPYRFSCPADDIELPKEATPEQQAIFFCLLSRNHDGYVRERAIEALLAGPRFDWVMPYIVKVSDEYVLPILQRIYESLRRQNCREYRRFAARNFAGIERGHRHMVSYWNEFYRCRARNPFFPYEACPFRDYVGKKLYAECFGYRKTGQKQIDWEET